MKQMDVAMDPLASRGRSSRTKGQNFERLVANMLTEATGATWKRRVRQHGNDSDVVTEDPAFQHVSIECKHADRLCIPAWWRQAQAQAGDKVPMLVYRQTGCPIAVIVDAHYVSPTTWPVRGRSKLTLDWESAMQWLRETARQTQFGDCAVLGV